MRSVSPDIGFQEVSLARDQHEFYELVAALVPYDDGTIGVTTRWRLSAGEVKALLDGERDVYLTLLTTDGRPQPVLLTVGAPESEEESDA